MRSGAVRKARQQGSMIQEERAKREEAEQRSRQHARLLAGMEHRFGMGVAWRMRR